MVGPSHRPTAADMKAQMSTTTGVAYNPAEAVKKVLVLGEEWLPDTDLLTPTSKLKRRGINARYAREIEALYG